MKKAVTLCVVAFALLAMPGMSAVTVSTAGGSWPYSPYTVSGLSGYDTPFKTFCVEWNVVFYPNPPYPNVYNATIDDVVMYYGDTSVPLATKPLAEGTKQIYAAYLNGQISKSANDIQSEIWWLENNKTQFSVNGFAAKDQGILSSLSSAQYAGYQNVKVLNLWDPKTGADAQSFMVVVVPAPSAILLGSLGVAIVGFLRKRIS